MEKLPVELRLKIFDDFTTNDLLLCRGTSSAWNRIILDLFSDRFVVIISSLFTVNGSLADTFKKLTEDKANPTFADFGKRIVCRDENAPSTSFFERGGCPELATALSDVHSLTFDRVTHFWFLRFFLNNIPRLESLTLAGEISYAKGAQNLEGLNPNALEHLKSFDISNCSEMEDCMIFELTAFMPNLNELNAANENVDYELMRIVPNGLPCLTFSALLRVLQTNTPRLKSIRLCPPCITGNSISLLLDFESLSDIYIDGTIMFFRNTKLKERLSELKSLVSAASKHLHYELVFSDQPIPLPRFRPINEFDFMLF